MSITYKDDSVKHAFKYVHDVRVWYMVVDSNASTTKYDIKYLLCEPRFLLLWLFAQKWDDHHVAFVWFIDDMIEDGSQS